MVDPAKVCIPPDYADHPVTTKARSDALGTPRESPRRNTGTGAWIATESPMPSAAENASLHKSASRLNNLLQVISRSSSALDLICGENADARRHLNALSTGLAGARLVVSDLLTQIGAAPAAPAPEAAPASTLSDTQPATPAATSPIAAAKETSPSPVPAASPESSSPVENPEGEKELVLIIDDEQTIVTYVTETLTMDGYRVIGCISPFEAIKAYKRHKDSIALVILDYTLPIMNGQEVFDELRAMNPRVAVMLSSGFAEQKDVNSMLARGLRGFLPKPYTQERLLAQVRSTIVGSRTGNSAAPATASPTTPPVSVPTGALEAV